MSALRFAGALLLMGACTGAGFALAWQKQAAWRQAYGFCLLLDYFAGGIRYQGLPGPLLLAGAAADDRFAAFDLAACASLADVPAPAVLGPALAAQARQVLRGLCAAPREQICAALDRLLEQCRERERALNAAAGEALRLYPRLGFCAGMAAVLLLL